MRLADGVASLGLTEITSDQVEQLESYTALVQKWNKTINLVSRQDVARFVTRHLLDSLSIQRWIDGNRCADIGTGAGLPGIPLAIVNPQRDFTLVDRSERKVRFLKQVIRTLDLQNVRAVAADVSALASQSGEQHAYHCVVSRAMAPAPELWSMAGELLAAGGRFVLQVAVGAQHSNVAADAGVGAERTLLTDDFAQKHHLCVQQHETQVPGLQSPHQVLVITKRTTP